MPRFTLVLLMATAAVADVCNDSEECIKGSSMLASKTITRHTDVPDVAKMRELAQKDEALRVALGHDGQRASTVSIAADTAALTAAVAAAYKADPPAAPAPAEAAAPAAGDSAGAASPEDLMKLSQAMATGQESEKVNSESMDGVMKASETVRDAQQKKAVMAGEAEAAHIVASDAHTQASDLSTQAADARDAANKAAAAAAAAKAHLDAMQKKEVESQTIANEREKVEKKANVAFDTAAMKAKNAKKTAQAADTKANADRDSKVAKEEQLFQADRVQAAALEKLTRAEADNAEKKTALELATAAFEKAKAASLKAAQEDEELEAIFGEKEALAAKARVEETVAQKDRELARTTYDAKAATAHANDESATAAEARAKAAAAESHELAASAKADADAVRAQ